MGIKLTVFQPGSDRAQRALDLRREVNRWCAETAPRHSSQMLDPHPEVVSDPRAAIESAKKDPEDRIIVMLMPSASEFDAVARGIRELSTDLVAVPPPTASMVTPLSSSPLANRRPTVSTQLLPSLHKAVLRASQRRQFEVRRLVTKNEFRDYFALRYRIWREMNYIPEGEDYADAGWELNWTDRKAVPFGIFVAPGRLVGCARLVMDDRDIGTYVKLISALIAEHSDISRGFERSARMEHPFDVLEAFPTFRDHYGRWVKEGISKAEVSRVIVDHEFRRHGLGEVLVDTLVDYAREIGIGIVFLACRAAHERFYADSGFTVMPGAQCDRFVNVDVPAIAMQQDLRSPHV